MERDNVHLTYPIVNSIASEIKPIMAKSWQPLVTDTVLGMQGTAAVRRPFSLHDFSFRGQRVRMEDGRVSADFRAI